VTIPDELVQQFRAVAYERLDRIEGAWATVLASLDEHAATTILRELHTLKGESMMLGFSDVNLVCHKLEDLMGVARARGYAVDDDFDLAVNMAVRFMAMLIRKKAGANLSGIDLPGFIAQLDALLAELRSGEGSSTTLRAVLTPAAAARSALPPSLRSRFGAIALELFVEYTLARGPRRDRLRASWHSLRDQIGIQRAIIGRAQLGKHKASAEVLARTLGKQVELVFEIGSVEATAEMLAVIDLSLLHLIRNAIDHGIEAPETRVACGKRATGTIHVHCGVKDDRLELVIEDDGRGISLDDVCKRALALGLINSAETVLPTTWFDLLCQPGFSTRSDITQVSGRGIGLDAVQNGIREVGGVFSATTEAGNGTSWQIAIPCAKASLQGHVLRVPSLPFPIAIDSSWRPCSGAGSDLVFDVACELGAADAHANAVPYWFRRRDVTIAILGETAPVPGSVRRIVGVPPPAPAEIASIDAIEGLLVHPDRLMR
jgi:two-component system chemotaxis sensor kinase CheA